MNDTSSTISSLEAAWTACTNFIDDTSVVTLRDGAVQDNEPNLLKVA
jgi:hypothetical protein